VRLGLGLPSFSLFSLLLSFSSDLQVASF
jgi:hypothetical protein